MPTDCISYQNSGYFSKLIVDYLNQEPAVRSFYHRFPTLENFKLQIEEKAASFPVENRKKLVASLKRQYQGFEVSEATQQNISSLESAKTFTC